MKAFQLNVSVRVTQIEVDDHDHSLIRHQSGGGLDLSESVVVNAAGFMEVCEILGQFHRLAESLNGRKK